MSRQSAPIPRLTPRIIRTGIDGPCRATERPDAELRDAVDRVPVVALAGGDAFDRVVRAFAAVDLAAVDLAAVDLAADVLVPDAFAAEVFAAAALAVAVFAAGVRRTRELAMGVAGVSPLPERGRGEAEVFPAICVTLVAAVTPVPVATPVQPPDRSRRAR